MNLDVLPKSQRRRYDRISLEVDKMAMKTCRGKILFWGLVAACLGLAVPLSLYAYNGSFMRYSGDDYCYASTQAMHGFWGMQWFSYNQAFDYHGNRFALTFFSGVAGLGPPQVSGLLPGLMLGLWILGMGLFMRRIVTHGLFTVSKRTLAAASWMIAGLIIFLTLYQSPEIKQSLYWRSGMLPYLAPLVSNTFLAYVILLQLQERISWRGWWLLTGFLAWLSGGFSETGLAMQTAYLSIWLAVLIISRRPDRRMGGLLGALAGSGLALIVLALSPALRLRSIQTPDNWLNLLWLPLKFSISFVLSAWRSSVLPTGFTVLVFGVLGVLGGKHLRAKNPLTRHQWVGILIGVVGVCMALVFASMLPSVYAQSAFPEPRALLLPQFVLVIGLAIGSMVAGLILQDWFSNLGKFRGWLNAACAVGLFVASVYPIYSARNILADTPKLKKWAVNWDQRDQQIRDAAASGSSKVNVMVLDTVIPRVMELSVEPSNWYNNCASGYYGINVLADQPGWDP